MLHTINDGLRIHYEVVGSGSPLVLYHGLTGSGQRWRDTGYVAGLVEDYRLILIDARGHGESDKPHDQEAYGRRRCLDPRSPSFRSGERAGRYRVQSLRRYTR